MKKTLKLLTMMILLLFVQVVKVKAEGIVIKISKDNKFVDSADAGSDIEIITNQTPFYGESGGQVGDQGIIFNSNCKINIIDTQKKMGDLFVHVGKVVSGSIKIGQSVNLEINVEKRNNSKIGRASCRERV